MHRSIARVWRSAQLARLRVGASSATGRIRRGERAPFGALAERVNAPCGKLDRSKIEMVSYYRPPASTACRRDSFRHAAKNNRLAACAP